MPSQPVPVHAPISRDRQWAEQLAMGLGLLMIILVFMACFHPEKLSAGSRVLGPNYVAAYGWASVVGILLQLVVHEGGTLIVAKWLKIPLKFRPFAFGANATAILEARPRNAWTDAVIGFAGPIFGSLFSVLLALAFHLTYNPEDPDNWGPFFLGMACVGYFYNLFTLIPILDLEGGWILTAIAPQAWLPGLLLAVAELAHGFNLVLLGVVCFGLPRFILLLRARAGRDDLECTTRQRVIVALCYFVLVLALARFSSQIFDQLAFLVPEAKGD